MRNANDSVRIGVKLAGFDWDIAFDAEKQMVVLYRSDVASVVDEPRPVYPVAIAEWNGESFEVRKWLKIRGERLLAARDFPLLEQSLRMELQGRPVEDDAP